jgi:hypothetical protein
MALGLTRLLTEITGIFPGSKGVRCVGLTPLPPSCTGCHETWQPHPPWTFRACPGLYRDCFYLAASLKTGLLRDLVSIRGRGRGDISSATRAHFLILFVTTQLVSMLFLFWCTKLCAPSIRPQSACGHETRSSPSSVDIKNVWIYTFTPSYRGVEVITRRASHLNHMRYSD